MTNGRTDSTEDVLADVRRVLDEPYERARRAHLWAEETAGERNWLALANFRDALDHQSRIYEHLEKNEIEKAKTDLAEMEAHIHRAAYESAQVPVEKRLSEVLNNRVSGYLYRITFLDAMNDDEYNEIIKKIREEMVQARSSKPNTGEGIEHFKNAYEHAEEIYEGTPNKTAVYFRLLILLSVLAMVLYAIWRLPGLP